MNIVISNVFLALLFSGIATIAHGQQNTEEIHQSILSTKGESKHINMKIFHTSEGSRKYSIRLLGKWVKGKCELQGVGEFYALFADLNFDNHQDIWVTGYSDSQGRSRCSDVWLFDPKTNKYEYNADLSKIHNLEVAPLEKKLEGGISNCGCAGQCFFHDTYSWQAGSLIKIARREQDCGTDTVVYQEYVLIDDKLTVVHHEEGVPDDKEYSRRQNGELSFIDWSAYPVK